MLGKMLIGEVSWKHLSGPVTIADYAGQSAQMGWLAYATFLALISISLGVLNLLPIPLLDGGQIFVTLLEAVVRRDFSLKVKERLLQAGFVFLVLVMVTVLYFDVLKNVSF